MFKIADEKTSSEDRDADRPLTMIIPVQHPVQPGEIERLYISGRQGYGATGSRTTETDEERDRDEFQEEVARFSAIQIFSTGDTPEETVANISRRSDMEPGEALTRVAECAAFWKSVGADTLIYVCSMGANLVANGLIIRFASADPFYSTLVFGGAAAVSYNNSQILFNALLKPPRDEIRDDRKTSYGAINKYALLPFSLVIKSAVTGSLLSVIGDPGIGTQQAVSAGTSPLVGPITTGIRVAIRKCYQGSYVLAPEMPGVGDAFRKAYGATPNTADAKRSHRYGTIRDMFAKLFGVTAGTLMLTYSGGFKIDTYCTPVAGQPVDLWNSSARQNSTAFPENCVGGNFTFMFRELGISFGYAIGFLVIEPAIAAVTNRIYDYFYPAVEEEENLVELEDNITAEDDQD